MRWGPGCMWVARLPHGCRQPIFGLLLGQGVLAWVACSPRLASSTGSVCTSVWWASASFAAPARAESSHRRRGCSERAPSSISPLLRLVAFWWCLGVPRDSSRCKSAGERHPYYAATTVRVPHTPRVFKIYRGFFLRDCRPGGVGEVGLVATVPFGEGPGAEGWPVMSARIDLEVSFLQGKSWDNKPRSTRL